MKYRGRAYFGEHSGVRLEQACGRVDPVALPFQPEARFRERHARRAADEEVRAVAGAEPPSPEDVSRGDPLAGSRRQRLEVGPDDLVQVGEVRRSVLLHRVGSILVPLDRGHGGEACCLDPQVEPARTGVQGDGGAHGQPTSLHGPLGRGAEAGRGQEAELDSM